MSTLLTSSPLPQRAGADPTCSFVDPIRQRRALFLVVAMVVVALLLALATWLAFHSGGPITPHLAAASVSHMRPYCAGYPFPC